MDMTTGYSTKHHDISILCIDDVSLLFVEDDDFCRKLIRVALPHQQVYIASHMEEGLMLYQAHQPDMVFLDIHMPEYSGLDMLRALKEMDPNAYVVMLTQERHYQTVIESVKEGAIGYILKPFSPAQLYEYIERYKCEKAANSFF